MQYNNNRKQGVKMQKLCEYGCVEEAVYQFKNGKWCCSEHYSQCPTAKEKRNATMSQIGDDGLTTFQRAANKSAKDRGEKIMEDGRTFQQHITENSQKTKLNTIDTNGRNVYQKAILKSSITKLNTINENGLNVYQTGGIKARKTGMENGHYRDDTTIENKDSYRRIVANFTAREYTQFGDEIDPNSLKQSGYQIDHIFSVNEGFLQGIPPWIISHKSNLQMLTSEDNNKKHDSCWKTKEQLFEDFEKSAEAPFSLDVSLKEFVHDGGTI